MNATLSGMSTDFAGLYSRLGRPLAELLAWPEVKRLLSSEHFSVDGTLIQAWASQKSFRRKHGGDARSGAQGRE